MANEWIPGVSNTITFGGVVALVLAIIAALTVNAIWGGHNSTPAGDASIKEVASAKETTLKADNAPLAQNNSSSTMLPVTVSDIDSGVESKKLIKADSADTADSSLVESIKNQPEMNGGDFMKEWTLSSSIETDASKIIPLNPGQTDELAALAASAMTDSQAADAVWGQIGGQFKGDSAPSVFYYKVEKSDVKAKSIAEQSKSRVITAELKPNLKIGEVEFEYYEILSGGNKVTVDKNDIKDLGDGTFYGADYALDGE